ncbi:MAG: high-potential iron-sulfur protein [bacterium]
MPPPVGVAEVDPRDVQAVALGYVQDAQQADLTRYPNKAADAKCSNCALFAGRPTDTFAMCPLFAGKVVRGAAWCSAWAR